MNAIVNLNLPGSQPSRVIALEEHFTTSAFLAATRRFIPPPVRSVLLEQRLLDLGEGRIAAMDEGDVDMQVLSLAATGQERLNPATATVLVREANDELAAAIGKHPDRFAGFASLALKEPENAAKELERGVQSLVFAGGFLNGTEGGTFLDHPRFHPIFEAAESLDVPLYLHPTPPSAEVWASYFAGLPEASAYFLSTAAWGWHAELGMHCLRLVLAGVFDRFPRLRILIGHMGENLPFSLVRAENGLPTSVTHLARSLGEYFQDHFSITTSGYFSLLPFLCALQVFGADRMMYSVGLSLPRKHPRRRFPADAPGEFGGFGKDYSRQRGAEPSPPKRSASKMRWKFARTRTFL